MSNRSQSEARAIAESVGHSDERQKPKETTLRLPQDSTADLRWFWNDAPGVLGLKAVNLDPSGGNTETEDTHRVEAACRYREISRILDRVGDARTRVLQRYHQEAVWRGLESFGVLAGVALITRAAKDGYRGDAIGQRAIHSHFVGWLQALSARTMPGHVVGHDDRELKAAILREAETRLAKACLAYETAKALRGIERKAEVSARNALISREARAHQERVTAGRPWGTDDLG